MKRAVNRLDLFTFSQSFVLCCFDFVAYWVLTVPLLVVVGPVAAQTGLGRHAFGDLKG